jgi:hypothetical protein
MIRALYQDSVESNHFIFWNIRNHGERRSGRPRSRQVEYCSMTGYYYDNELPENYKGRAPP